MKTIMKMKTILFKPLGLLLFFLLATQISFAQVAIKEVDTDAHPKAALDVESTTKGVLLPNLSQTERDNLYQPATGLMIYNRTVGYFNYYNGTKWCRVERTLVVDPAINPTTVANDVGVGVGIEDPDNSALLHINANNKGILLPRTTTGPTGVLPAGLIFYNTAINMFVYYNNTEMVRLTGTVEGDAATTGSNVQEGVVIGATTVAPTAKLELVSTNLGVLFPRMDNAQRDAIRSPAEGLLIYNTTSNTFQYFTDNKWYALAITVPTYTTVVPFAYTGNNQTFTVPAGVYTILAKMWGAGGAGGTAWSYQYSGGAGGYAWARMAVIPGEVYTVIVGQQGRVAAGSSFGGGGNNADATYGGGGGGRSAIRLGATELVTAGGGGGGGCMYNWNYNQSGGAGGGLTGQNAVVTGDNVAGRGGTQTAGGVGQGGNGAQYTGGASGGTPGHGASGGGGYYGGAGGLYGGTNAWYMGGGGGGSSYYGGANVITGGTTAGNFTTVGNSGDADRAGAGVAGGAGANGGHGRVVIRY